MERLDPRRLDLARLRATRLSGVAAWLPTIVRVAAGVFFVSASTGKFFDYAKEVDDFRRFEVPIPEIAVPMAGVVELIGGILLIVGLLTRPASLALLANMVVALATAGRVEGGSFHLVYPPILIAATGFLLWAGPGRRSVDACMAARRAAPGSLPAGPVSA